MASMRAALNAALIFLVLNGHDIDAPQKRLYDAMTQIGRNELDKPGLALLLRRLAGIADAFARSEHES